MRIGPAQIDVPDGVDPIGYVWGTLVAGIGPAAAAFAQSVYEHSTLALPEFEAARLRTAQINGCQFCLDWRTERNGEVVGNDFPDDVRNWRDSSSLDTRTRLAAEYAERYALAHHELDDDFWRRMNASFTAAEVTELSMCLGSWLAFGRLNHVLGLDAACSLPAATAQDRPANRLRPATRATTR